MDYRYLGGSGLKVSELGFGTVTFGGSDETARGFGATEVAIATRLVDICLDAASHQTPAYPYFHQNGFERNPFPVEI